MSSPSPARSRLRPGAPPRARLLPFLLIPQLAIGCGAGGEPDLARAMEEHFGTPRPVEPRLSTLGDHAPCEDPAPLCAGARADRPHGLVAVAARLRAADHADPVGRLLRGATLELAAAAGEGNGAGASVSLIEDALDHDPGSAAAWSDLAAARLIRAGLAGHSGDRLRAIDAASRAVEADSAFAPGRFNLALALERFGLPRTAAKEWIAYHAIDATSGWGAEASARADRLARTATVHDTPRGSSTRLAGPDSVTVAELARRDPQGVRLLAQETLLPAWGGAVLDGDSARARRSLSLATHAGRLLADAGGDRSVERLAREAGTAAGEAARDLAEAHVAFGRGRRSFGEGAYGAAGAAFLDAEASLPGAVPTMAGWTAFYRAAILMYGGRTGRAREELTALLERTDRDGTPALAGRAEWGLGSLELRGGRFAAARDRFQRAAALFERAGERENFGATRYLTAEATMALGQSWTAVDSVAAAVGTLGEAGATVWLHNLLYSAAEHALGLGLGRAALALQDEGVAVAAALGIPLYHAEALLARGRLRFRAGRLDEARRDLDAADSLAATLDDPGARAWIANDRRHTAALLDMDREPLRAADTLDSVASFFADVGSVPRQATALLDRARALLAAGRPARHRAVLAEVLRLGEDRIRAAPDIPLRASLASTVHDALVAAVDHDLAAGDPGAALAALSGWSRARAGERADAGPASGEAIAGRDADVALSYVLLDDAIAVLVQRGGALDGVRVPVPRAEVERLAASVARAGRRGAGEAAFRSHLADLYDLLVAPVLGREDVPARLLVHADGVLAGIPFPALFDREGEAYLIQKAVVAQTATPGGRPASSDPRGTRLLAVAADRFEADPALPALPAAAGEARAVAGAYRAPTVLTGRDATPAAVRRAVRDADVLHFAGHAVLSAERPWASRLVLASDTAGAAMAVPEMIAAFRGLSVVVLASCRSASPDDQLAEGFAGLAEALAAAGVHATIGAIWEIGDEDAAAVLLPFHRRLAGGDAPGEALRAAQLEMIHSPVARHRSPAVWAAYRATVR